MISKIRSLPLSSLLMFAVPALAMLTAAPFGIAFAYPVIDQVVPTHGEPIKVYPDHQTPGVYWYIPQSIEPWHKNDNYQSALYQSAHALTFVFRGQASVDSAMLDRVAQALGTSPGNFAPIAYEYSRNFQCQNVYDDAQLKWVFPKMIGNYLEIVPISLRTTNPDLIEELSMLLNTEHGLACTVEVGFKGVSTAYNLSLHADMDQVYSRFEAAAHAEVLWWEADAHTLIENLVKDKTIRVESLEDASMPQTELDKKTGAAMDEIVKHIVAEIFTPSQKLPDGPMEGRGKAFSLRVDYRRSEQHSHYSAVLDSRKVNVKDTQISVRLSTK
jgi:hypothetical protein